MKLIEMNMDKIITLCRKYRVAQLWVFGSILTPRFNADSDVDFSVNFDDESIRRDGLTGPTFSLTLSTNSKACWDAKSTWYVTILYPTNIFGRSLMQPNNLYTDSPS